MAIAFIRGDVLKVLFASAAALVLAVASAASAAELSPPDPNAPANIAQMSQGYTYFNLPGADRDLHDREVMDCIKTATFARAVDELVDSDDGLLLWWLADGPKRGVHAASVENCMVVKGWRVAMLEPAAGKALTMLEVAEIQNTIEPWIGAEPPPHTIVRTWNNEAARASTVRYDIRPAFIAQGSLSTVSVMGTKISEPGWYAPPNFFPRVKLDKKWPNQMSKAKQIAAAPEGSAIVLFHIKGGSRRNGSVLGFQREWINGLMPPSTRDFAPDYIEAAQFGAKQDGRMVAWAVPPGKWRLATMDLLPAVNFCLGSPSFEVAAGDVIYGGSFDMSAEDLSPDLDLGRPLAFLAGQPAADRLKPAIYTNGSTGPCAQNTLYAIEFAGAPFQPGYTGGSRAPKAPPSFKPKPKAPHP